MDEEQRHRVGFADTPPLDYLKHRGQRMRRRQHLYSIPARLHNAKPSDTADPGGLGKRCGLTIALVHAWVTNRGVGKPDQGAHAGDIGH
jgi:hypothetical protein